MLNVSFITLGCKVNQFESEAMMELFESEGFIIIPACDKSDIFIINTCAVTKESDRKSRQLINKAKRINKNAIVVAVGCSVQLNSERISKETSVDIVIGTKNKSEIARLIKEKLDSVNNANKISDGNIKNIAIINDDNFNDDDIYGVSEEKTNGNNVKSNVAKFTPHESFEELSISKEHDKTRVNIKIQDGCNQFCSYCIIPYVRGPIRSRNEEDVIKEIKTLANNGYKEIVLNGIHLSSFGKDLKKEDALISIIEEINNIDGNAKNGVERIRFGSLEQGIITDNFMQRLSKLNKICDHFHLSLQSGSDTVLQRMNRKYTASEYMNKVDLIRKHMPNSGITTDIIVGFPGETEAEFNETLDFVKKINFSRIHVFKYSVREGTKAASFENQIDEKIKSERSKKLISLANKMTQNFMQEMLGKTISVLIEKKNGNLYEGYTTNYLRTIVESDIDIENQIVNAEVIRFEEDCLISLMTKEGNTNA
jgi:threonylcarbamoyladenosine tRNA methylthiotransferase MtaB